MKRIKYIAMRIMPVAVVIMITLALSVHIYHTMLNREKENCWNGLNMATGDVAREITIRFEDNLKILDLAADAILMNTRLENSQSLSEYLATVRHETIYERIDILFPNETLISQAVGEDKRPENRRSYSELLKAGPHLSTRTKDPYTSRDAIYYFTPIIYNGEPKAILIGAIDCGSLGNLFESEHYSGNSQVVLIDRRDGQLLIDKRYTNLGNIYDTGKLQLTKTYKDVDFVKEIMEGNNSQVAFVSKTTNAVSYMSYMPVEKFPFSISLFLPEKTILKDVYALKELLLVTGFVELILLLGYLIINTYIVAVSVDNQEKAQAAELEREKNIAKTRFLSSVSHDIRTPLNGIVGMLDIIKLHEDDPVRVKDCLKKIDISTKYLLTLANDVLDMNEIDTGKIVLENEPVDLKGLVNELDMLIQQKAKESNVSYHIDLRYLKNPYVYGSAVHIYKILSNLVSNAIKYNKNNGKIWITIEDKNITEKKADYCFTVKDSGIGMTEEFQKNMFNAFEQEKAGARTSQVGHGLGLSIVKRLVEKMNGQIKVESEQGVGTTFVVTLPLEINFENYIKEEKITNTPSDIAGTRVLLVEDNELNMEIAQVLLTEAGAKVTTAHNGRIALEIFENSEPYNFDVILMDIMMPELNGYEATGKIRGLDREDARTIPIIAMTATTFSEDIKRCKEVGMNEHIGKPIDFNSLIAKIVKYSQKFRLY